MKRAIAMLLSLVLALGLVLPAGASGEAERAANVLHALGLFQGKGTGADGSPRYALEDRPTRHEAVTMLVRLLGKESEAQAGSWDIPFTDVADWAKPYVGYAYANGLTNGTGATTFSGAKTITATQYLTFVLRALGYDSNTDFRWDAAWELSDALGLTHGEYPAEDFLRGDVALISAHALPVAQKGGVETLAQKLMREGVFTQAAYERVLGAPAAQLTELSAEEIYLQCAPAVFFIEVADETGEVFATGSGFFIDSNGTAVTNYHVINGGVSATVTLSTTKAQYPVVGVYDYNEEEDWAILQVEGEDFPYLPVADSSTVVGGAKCYAIGSPRGLQKSITEGIISNPAQDLGGMCYIQISAAISHGSSGGALLNKYGQVIGITSAGYEDGENLGFALPIPLISGFNHRELLSLSDLFLGMENEALAAYSYLAAFVTVMQNDAIMEGVPCYTEVEETESGGVLRKLFYDEEEGYVGVQIVELYGAEGYWTTLVYEPDSILHFVSYTYADSLETSEPALEAYSYLYAPGFTGSNLEFSEIEVNTGYDVELNEYFASGFVQDALGFTDYIFAAYLADFGDFDVSLFGFEQYWAE